MISFLFRLTLVLLAALLLGWAIPILTSDDALSWLSREERRLKSAMPEGYQARPLMAKARIAAERAGEIPFAELLSESYLTGTAMALAVTAIRSEICLRILPLAGLLVLVSVLVGLMFRERIRHTLSPERHYSVTFGFLSKFILGAGVLLGVLFALSPVPFPYWIPYFSTLTTSFGAFGYASTLVDKL